MEHEGMDYDDDHFPHESTYNPGRIIHNYQEEWDDLVLWAQRIGLPPVVYQKAPAPPLFWEDECPKLLHKYQGRPEQQLMALARLVRLIDKRELAWRVLYRSDPNFYDDRVVYQSDSKTTKYLEELGRKEQILLDTGQVAK